MSQLSYCCADRLIQIQQSRNNTTDPTRQSKRKNNPYVGIFLISKIRIQISLSFNRSISTQGGCYGCIKKVALYPLAAVTRRAARWSAWCPVSWAPARAQSVAPPSRAVAAAFALRACVAVRPFLTHYFLYEK